MSTDDVFDRVYRSSSDPTSQRALYDDWAESYDHDLEASGYALRDASLGSSPST